MKNRNYIEILESFLQGNISKEDKKLLLEWFNQPNVKQEILTAYLNKWNTTSPTLDVYTQANMLKSIHAKIDEVERKSYPKRTLKTTIMKYAAVACMLVIVGLGSYFLGYQNLYTDKEYVVTVDKGQKATVTLPDGTKVWLNSFSELKYNNAYNGKDRKIALEGEAYFEVAKNENKRFIVQSNGIDIEALGTSFNVKSYIQDKLITVTLLEGKLGISDEKSHMYLDPSQRLAYNMNKKAFAKLEVLENAENVSKWRDNELVFYRATLEEIMIELSRMYNVDVKFIKEEAKAYQFSGVIKNNSLHNVINIVTAAAPINCEIKNNTIEIR